MSRSPDFSYIPEPPRKESHTAKSDFDFHVADAKKNLLRAHGELGYLPASRELALVKTKIEEAEMWLERVRFQG
jgi:hypothetical protein